MVSKDFSIGNKVDFTVQFPCPCCNDGNIAEEHFKKIFPKPVTDKDIIINAAYACSKGHIFYGDIIVHAAGLDVEVHIDNNKVKSDQIKVS
jgi:hypothetical protein